MLVSCCGDRYCASCAHATFRALTSIFSPSPSMATPAIFLLDLDRSTAEVLPRMRANGHEPSVLLRTSPGHSQAWISVSATPLEAAVATAIAKQVAHTYGGAIGMAERAFRLIAGKVE